MVTYKSRSQNDGNDRYGIPYSLKQSNHFRKRRLWRTRRTTNRFRNRRNRNNNYAVVIKRPPLLKRAHLSLQNWGSPQRANQLITVKTPDTQSPNPRRIQSQYTPPTVYQLRDKFFRSIRNAPSSLAAAAKRLSPRRSKMDYELIPMHPDVMDQTPAAYEPREEIDKTPNED